MAILVTGGAGYIGSAVVEDLRDNGEDVVVIDNLVYGHREAVDESVSFFRGDIGDKKLVGRALTEHSIEAVMHFSAYAYVGESVEKPGKYFKNNVSQTIELLSVLAEHGVRSFVFSSTCSIYGEPRYVPIDEKHPKDPTNPYGMSKLMVEQVLQTFDTAYGFKSVALRYFNAAGATEKLGEHHEPETHLIPLVLAAAAGSRDSVSIYGGDYPTRDGTAVRDYIHVSDLSRAHILALDLLRAGGESTALNLGNGSGYSVKEVIDAAREVTGREITSETAGRRAGDPSTLIADSSKARNVLGWKPEISGIKDIISSAWKWHAAHPRGYE